MIRDEIEILEVTLAPYEITHEIVEQETESGEAFEKHIIELTIVPTELEEMSLAITVLEDSKIIPIQTLPRLILRFEFSLIPSLIGDYPSRAKPDFKIKGFFAKYDE